MPTPPKALDQMSKNLTQEERELREQAEEGVLPDRGREPNLERPALMTKNPAAARYWSGWTGWASWTTWTATRWASIA